MGLTRSDLFTERQNRLAALAKALGHPARIAILDILLQSGRCINGHLVQELGLAQATVSQHLQELKAAGLIRGEIAGPAMCYCIDPAGWHAAGEALIGLFGAYQPGGALACGPEDGCC
jgi:predicted transcriptional regulator